MLFDLKSLIPVEFKKSEFPYMNEPSYFQDYITTKPKVTYDNLDFWIERTPEVISILNAIATDIKADGFRFVGGKQAVSRAEKWCKSQNFGDEFFKFLWDWLKYGDSYLWIGGIEPVQRVQESIKQKFKIEFDEDLPTQIKYVPTNTMNIIHDGRRITAFKQTVSGQQELKFPVQDIIHGSLLPNKGKVYSFSPTHSYMTEMNILGYLKDYAGTFFKNGGVPDWMFVLPNEMAGSPNHKNLITMLQTYKNPQRKHGNLVFAGEVNATQIGLDLKSIDISALTILLTSVFALAHNMPAGRVASLIGAKVKTGTGGDDLANEGYWSKIAEHQDRHENWLNYQLFKRFFDVEIRFNRAWKTNEIKEQQRNAAAISNITKLNQELSNRYSKQVNLEYVKRVLYLREDELEEGKLIEQSKGGNPFAPGGKDNPDDLDVEGGTAKESYRKQKKKEVNPEQDKSGY